MHKSQNLLYRLSVSADMEKFISVIYRYWPIRKLDLSVIIGIGRYGKRHIDRTLTKSVEKLLVFHFLFLFTLPYSYTYPSLDDTIHLKTLV